MQSAVLVDKSDIACAEPSVRQNAVGLLRVMVITEHHVFALNQNLSVFICLYRVAAERYADTALHGKAVPVDRDDRGALRYSVPVQHGYSQ